MNQDSFRQPARETTLPDVPFGQLLLGLRLAAGMTQEALAERCGLSARTVSDLERGTRPVPHPATALVLADALDASAENRDQLLNCIVRHRQLVAAGARAAAAGPAVPAGTAEEPVLLGRDAELAAIERLLAGGDRLLTLAGPGGVGKSRLARAVAAGRRLANQPVVEVPLEALSSPDQVIPAIARAVGLTVRGARVSLSRLAAILSATPPLLVLDNFEHVLGAAAITSDLIQQTPGLAVLVTSREALRVRYERTLALSPLPLPDPDADPEAQAGNPAVALFLRTVAAAAPGRTVHPGDVPLAASIVRRLDGLPLAIELAAAQATVLPLATLVGLLDRAGLAVLTTGNRDNPARFATMEAAISWSADLLSPEARRLLRLLAVFRGGFTSSAIFGVAAAAGEPGLVGFLPRLAESHLIERDLNDPEHRMRMLEPIRLFAQDHLRQSGDEPAARRAHAGWFLSWAREQAPAVAGPDPVHALDALDADLPNLLAAFGHADPADALAAASALGQYWELRNRFREGRAVLADAIAANRASPAPPPPGDLLDAIYWSAYLAYLQSDLAAVTAALDDLRPLAAAEGSAEHAARALLLEVLRRDLAGLPAAESVPLARQTQELAAASSRKTVWLLGTMSLANLLVQCGEAKAALPLLRECVANARARNAAAEQNSAEDYLGFALLETGAVAEARARFADSIVWSLNAGSTGTIYLPLMGYILAVAGADAAPPDLEHAAVLLGALEADTARYGYPLGDRYVEALAACRLRMAAELGDTQLAALLARGRVLALEDALDLVAA